MTQPTQPPIRILVVEPEEELRRSLCFTLRRQGWKVTGISDWSEILGDTSGRLRGYTVVVAEADQSGAPRGPGHRLWLTEYGAPRRRLEARGGEQDVFVEKPVPADRLVEAIRTLLRLD